MKKKKKMIRNPEVIGGEENRKMIKANEMWRGFGKQNRKEDEACGKENEIKVN